MNRMRRLSTAATSVTLGLTLGVALTGCAGDGSREVEDASGATTTVNDADVELAQMMIVHHEGAIEMADLAVERASTDEVRDLAEGIAAAQGPEIETMTGWLEAWDEKLPDDADMGGMDHGGMDMEGMDQEEVMAELEGLSGADLDRRFLELMIDHHRGALDMAQEHLDKGAHEDALELSRAIVADQQDEIAVMEEMLTEL